MGKIKNKIGLKHGKLLILELVIKDKRVHYKCKCDCGNICVVRSDRLFCKRNTVSCGCYQKEFASKIRVPKNHSYFTRVFAQYRCNARTKNIPFQITFNEFKILVVQNCYYCGDEPSRKDSESSNTDVLINGIDRIVPSLGYVNGNMLPCCYTCNWRKREFDKQEFISWINKAYHHLIKIKEIK